LAQISSKEKVELLHEKFRELGFIDYDRHLGVHSSRLTVVLNEQGRAMALTAIELNYPEARLGLE
jgi:hypothetical protein